jgi:AmmeMemoRadiSam system protein A
MTIIMLSKKEQKIILDISRKTLHILFSKERDNSKSTNHGPDISAVQYSGAFVSLYNNNRLRGCIGRFNCTDPINKTIEDLTRQSALFDSRFEPLSENEIPDIKIEISILTPLERFLSPEEIELGKHGIYIKYGINSGTFLPQVASKTGWTKEEFLGYCSRDKAGIGWEGWKNAELYRYEAVIISD